MTRDQRYPRVIELLQAAMDELADGADDDSIEHQEGTHAAVRLIESSYFERSDSVRASLKVLCEWLAERS